MGKVTQFDVLGTNIQFLDFNRRFRSVDILDVKPVRVEGHEIEILEIHHLLGVGEERRGVAGDELLIVADPDHERAAPPGPEDQARTIEVNEGDPVGSLQLAEGTFGGVLKRLFSIGFRLVIILANEVSQHLGIGGGDEAMTGALQLLAERLVVVDNTIVHEGESPGPVRMGVGIDVVGLAMGGPAGV
jgi:hypothetical protein